MDWIRAATDTTLTPVIGGTVTQYIVLPSEVMEQFTDPTLVRTVGAVIIRGASAGLLTGAWGVINWPDINDTPPASEPNPITGSNLDWLLHGYFFSVLTGDQLDYRATVGWSGGNAESKAQRRLGAREGVLFCMSISAASAVAASVRFGFSCLLKDG